MMFKKLKQYGLFIVSTLIASSLWAEEETIFTVEDIVGKNEKRKDVLERKIKEDQAIAAQHDQQLTSLFNKNLSSNN